MADKLKQMLWKKILLVEGILMVAFVAGLCVQKPEGIEPTPLQPSEEQKLSDFPEAFKDSTLIIVGDDASDIEMQTANEIADYLENETGNKALIKKYSEVSEEDKRNYNLIVVGTPKTNPFLEEVYALTNATRVTEEFPGEGKGVLEILPNPWDESKAMLLVEGWDERGVKAGSEKIRDYNELSESSITISFTEPTVPLDIDLSIEGLPKLNQTVKLIVTVTGLLNLPNTSLQIQLPEGFILINGDLSWKGALTTNEIKKIQALVKPVKVGNWTIKAVARSYHEWGFYGKEDILYISVSEETATVTKEPPIPPQPPMEERVGTQVDGGKINE